MITMLTALTILNKAEMYMSVKHAVGIGEKMNTSKINVPWKVSNCKATTSE